MRKKLNSFLLVSMICLIVVLSVSNIGVGGSFSYVFHFSAYFMLSSAFLLFFHDSFYGHFEAFLLAFSIGFILETVQFFIPFRTFSWYDVLVNGLGGLMVFLDHRISFVTCIIEMEDRFIERFFK